MGIIQDGLKEVKARYEYDSFGVPTPTQTVFKEDDKTVEMDLETEADKKAKEDKEKGITTRQEPDGKRR